MENQKLTLTLKPVKTVLNKIVCREKVDITILNKLINSSLLKDTFNNSIVGKIYANEKEQLLKYKSIIDTNGYANVKYNKTKDISFGRVFPNKSLGFISIRREIRQTLAKNYYVDIDVENCHPTMLLQICEHFGLECRVIKKYVSNRDKYLKHCMNEYGIDREQAKRLFIILLYGGSLDKWYKDNNIEIVDNSLTRFLCYFEKTIKAIGNILATNNKMIVEELQNKKDEEINNNSIQAYYLQEYEYRVISCVYEYLNNNNYIVNNDCAICHDGIMIPKDKYNEKILEELSDEVFNKIGFRLTFTQKEMKQDYLNILDDNVIDNTISKPVDGYENKKKLFEETHFKLTNPISYITIEKDGELIEKKKYDFLNTYENLYYTDFIPITNKEGDITGYKPVQTNLVNKWMKDENIRTYNKIDFMPRMTTPEGVYNTFTEYVAVSKPKKNINIEDTLMYKHLNNLCGNDDKVFDYVIKWLANRVQTPYEIPRTALLFKSIDGCGKNVFFDWFGCKILGAKYYAEVEEVELLFGRFNDIIKDKILIIGNEIQASKTINLNESIKYAITTENNSIESKGKQVYKNRNNIGYVFLTNNEFPLKITKTDRRFIAIKCNNDIANNNEYFTNLRNELNSGNIDRAFYDYLMNIDLSEINFTTDRPETDYYEDIKMNYMEPHILFINNLLRENIDKENYEIMGLNLFKIFDLFIKDRNIKCDISMTKFALRLKEFSNINKKICKKGNLYYFNIKELINELRNKNLLIDDFDNIEDEPQFKEDDNNDLDQI
jgi:hypothetical protein